MHPGQQVVGVTMPFRIVQLSCLCGTGALLTISLSSVFMSLTAARCVSECSVAVTAKGEPAALVDDYPGSAERLAES